MKKFLTVLLALSVVFTYTVGSAFATIAAPDPKDQLSATAVRTIVDEAYTAAKAELLKAKNDALYDIFGNDSTATLSGVEVSKAAVEAVYDAEIFDEAMKTAEQEYETMLEEIQKGITAEADYFYIGTPTTPNPDKDADGKTGYAISTTFTITTKTAYTALVNGTAVFDGGKTYATADLFNAAKEAADGHIYIKNGNTYEEYTGGHQNATTKYYILKTPFGGTKVNAVAQEEANALKEATLAAVRNYDLSVYSKEYNGEEKSQYDLAVEAQQDAISALNGISIKDTTTWQDVYYTKGIVNQIKAVYVAAVNNQPATGTFADALAKLVKTEDEPTAAAKLEWAKTQMINAITNDINAVLDKELDKQNKIILDETLKGSKGDADKIAAAKEAIDAAKEKATAATEVATYLVNDVTALTELITEKTPFSTSEVKYGYGKPWYYSDGSHGLAVGTLYADEYSAVYSAAKMVELSNHVADLKDDAEILQSAVMIDGEEFVAIEKALEKAIHTTYTTGALATLDVKDFQKAVWDRMSELVYGESLNKVVVNDKKYAAVNSWLNGNSVETSQFEERFYDQVRSTIKEAKTAIYAAATIEDADAAFLAAWEKFDAIPTETDKASVNNTKEFADLKAQYKKDIASYATFKDSSITNAGKEDDYSWKASEYANVLAATLDDAYTVDELKTLYAEAKAAIDSLKTKAQLEEAKKALDAKIKDVDPAKVTVADRDAIGQLKADIEDHNEYIDDIDASAVYKVIVKDNVVNNAYAKIKTAEEKAIKDAIKAIGAVTVDDADAIEALRAQLDAYVAYYAGENTEDATITALEAVNYNGTDVADLEADLADAFVKEWKVLVAKLPADGSDVAGIKEARALFEKLPLAKKMEVYRLSLYDKLLDQEKLIIKNVEALKIKVYTKLYTKSNKIRVNWKTTGIAAAADGYYVYKSTKAQTGYKFMGKTTKNYMDNKKNLKKGKRYFYKVKAYVEIDGVKYFSDDSNKGNRIYK